MTTASRLDELFATAVGGRRYGYYRVGVKRAWIIAAGLVMSGATAMGCGGSTAATTTTSAPAYTGYALSWLSAKARPFNKKLNDDQAVVDVASAATGEIDPTTYFGRLASACTRLANDARQAGEVQAAPTASLATAWRAHGRSHRDLRLGLPGSGPHPLECCAHSVEPEPEGHELGQRRPQLAGQRHQERFDDSGRLTAVLDGRAAAAGQQHRPSDDPPTGDRQEVGRWVPRGCWPRG